MGAVTSISTQLNVTAPLIFKFPYFNRKLYKPLKNGKSQTLIIFII